MYEIIKLLFDICLFKKGPQDLPYSPHLQKLLIIAFAVIRFLMLNDSDDRVNALMQITVEIIYISGFIRVLLSIKRKLQRFSQVACAFYGTFAMLGFFSLPAIASMAINRGGWLVFIAMLALTGWFCAVTAHIFYHALDRQLGASIGVAFLFLMGSYLLLDFLFPGFSKVN